jgi:hypothetical protein
VWTVEQSRLERAAELIAAGIHEVHTRRDGLVRLDDMLKGRCDLFRRGATPSAPSGKPPPASTAPAITSDTTCDCGTSFRSESAGRASTSGDEDEAGPQAW